MPETASGDYRRRALITTAIVLGSIILLYFLWQAMYVLMLIFAGALLAIFLHSLAMGLKRITKLADGWNLAIVVVLIIALSVLCVWIAAPRVSEQIDQLADTLPKSFDTIKAKVETFSLGRWLLHSETSRQLFDPKGSQIVSKAGGFVSGALGALVAVVVIGFIGLYFAIEPRLYTNGVLRLIPIKRRERGAEVLGALGYTLRWFLIGQFIDMWIIGAATAIGLWILGVPLALLMGILAGLFNFIPNFGPLIAMVPATLLGLTIGPDKALAVIVLFFVLQNIEGYVLLPLLQKRAVDLPPVLLIATQVLFGVLLGALGLILATPLLAVGMVLVKMLYVEEALGDEIETPEDNIGRKDIPSVPKPDGKRSKKS